MEVTRRRNRLEKQTQLEEEDANSKKKLSNADGRRKFVLVFSALFCILASIAFVFRRDRSSNGDEEWSGDEAAEIEATLLVSFRPFIEQEESHPNKSVRSLPDDLSSLPPGYNGLGVLVKEDDLGATQREDREMMLNTHAFDEFVSELIPLERPLPDWRSSWCETTYPSSDPKLPTTSIVMCFHNEALSTLLRSLYSIVNRSPPRLIAEILVIDDASDLAYLGETLQKAIDDEVKFAAVKLIRLSERHGLIRCRLRGVREAAKSHSGSLTFLDSHIEAGHGWLEPLLSTLRDRPNVSVVINHSNNQLMLLISFSVGDRLSRHRRYQRHDLSLSLRGRRSLRPDELATRLRVARIEPRAPCV